LSCCAFGCTNRYFPGTKKHFFRIPSTDVVDCTSTVRDVNCDVNSVEVNTGSDVSTDNVNCDVSSVQDNYSSNVSDTDITSNNKGIPDVSTVTEMETTETAVVISRVRIHVERVKGQLKKKYTILAGPFPIRIIKKPRQ